jgi:hypothetical protein
MRRPRPIHALLTLLVATGLLSLWATARANAGIDFYQMWLGPRIAREVRNFYAPAVRDRMGVEYFRRALVEEPTARRLAVAGYRRRLETLSTPLLYLLYAPFRGSYENDMLLFQLLMFASFLLWLTTLTRLSGYGAGATLALLAFLLWSFEPIRSDVVVANMNHVMLALLAASAACLTSRRPALAGALLAVATLIKPYVILTLPVVALLWFAQRRFREASRLLAGAVGAAIVCLSASSVFFRSATIWPEWLHAFRAMSPSITPVEVGNFAVSELLRRATGVTFTPLLLGIPLLVVLTIARKVTPTREHDRLAIWLACVVFQFGSPLVWVHHLLLGMPLLIHLLRPASPVLEGEHSQRGAVYRQGAALTVLAIFAIKPWDAYMQSAAGVAILVNAAIVLLFLAGVFDLVATESTESDAPLTQKAGLA